MEEACPGTPRLGRPPDETLAALLGRSAAILRNAGIPDPMREARLLVAHALGLSADALLRLRRDATVPVRDADLMVGRRAAREPLAFITGRQGFWSLDLAVSPATLVPRADTEAVVEAALEAARGRPAPPGLVLDLGTGTGAILLALLSEWPGAAGIGIDRSEDACRLARRNAVEAGLGGRASFLGADWVAALAPAARFDVVVSNPPYVPSDELARLMPEVGRHEPALALDGGRDGLDAYRLLLPAAARHLDEGGIAVLEIGAGQADAVSAIAREAGLAPASSRRDLGGHVRALAFRKGDAADR